MKNLINKQIIIKGRQLIAGATEYPLWGAQAVYAFPTAAAGLEILSASANDASAGTGIRTIQIDYLDSNYAEKSTIVTLNGTSVVATSALDIFRVNRIRTLTAGTGLKAAGLISLRNLADTPFYAYILAGYNESEQCIYTVPAGKELYIEEVTGSLGSSAAGKSTTFFIKSNYDRESDSFTGYGATGILLSHYSFLTMDSSVNIPFKRPLRFPAKSDIIVTCIGTAAGVATFDMRGLLLDAGEDYNNYARYE